LKDRLAFAIGYLMRAPEMQLGDMDDADLIGFKAPKGAE